MYRSCCIKQLLLPLLSVDGKTFHIGRVTITFPAWLTGNCTPHRTTSASTGDKTVNDDGVCIGTILFAPLDTTRRDFDSRVESGHNFR